MAFIAREPLFILDEQATLPESRVKYPTMLSRLYLVKLGTSRVIMKTDPLSLIKGDIIYIYSLLMGTKLD